MNLPDLKFRGLDIEELDLDKLDILILNNTFEDMNPNYREFEHCRFIGCDFEGFIFRGVTFKNCRFEGCQISGSKLQSCSLENCLFERCDFGVCDFFTSFFDKVTWIGCILEMTEFSKCTMLDFSIHDCRRNIEVEFINCYVKNLQFDQEDLFSCEDYSCYFEEDWG